MARTVGVISHWHLLIDAYHTSALDFFARVEAALAERQVPQIEMSRIDWKESGLLSAKREYLRIKRGSLIFDIGAAPFGTGYFFSWWLVREPPRYVFLFMFLALLALLVIWALCISIFGFFPSLVLAPLVIIGVFTLLANAMRAGTVPGEDLILAMPVLGPLYERFFAPATYYAADTARTYQESVHRAVIGVIEELRRAQGLRALAPKDTRPITTSILR